MYSPSIQNLIRAFKKLPSVGERTAERFVFHLLQAGKKEVGDLTLALSTLLNRVKSCGVCWNFTDVSPCPLCRNSKRDHAALCVVEGPASLAALEHTGEYTGMYHVLRGFLDPTDEHSLARIKIKELLQRIQSRESKIKEVILAFNPDVAGETTMLYLEKEIRRANPNLAVTRLARGLPLGSDMRYADDITLASAIKNRVRR